MMMTKIMMSLLPAFVYFHSTWDSTEEDKRTLDNLRSRLMLEEKRIQLNNDASTGESALFAKGTNFKRFNDKNTTQKKGNTPGKCFLCGKGSHWKRDCPDRKNSSDSRMKGNSDNAFCCQSIGKFLPSMSDECDWYMDSGATEHMASNRTFFKNYKSLEQRRPVRIGDGRFMYALGIGDIDVDAYDGENWISKHMLAVLHSNLFSQGTVLDKGGRLISNNQKCEFIKDGRIVAVGMGEKGLYKMLIRSKPSFGSNANVAKGCENIHIWHERLVHQNIAQVRKVLRKNGIDFIEKERLN